MRGVELRAYRAKENHEVIGSGQRADFARDGFFTLPSISAAAEVELIRKEITALFDNRVGFNEGALTDLVATDGQPRSSPQILNPSNYSAALRRTRHREACFAIAREILGPDAKLAFEQALFKPAEYGAPTPWHQDDAFTSDADADVDQITIWMPLQDVDEENACMRYIAGSHRMRLLEHRSPGGDPSVQALECVLPDDLPEPTYVPLPAGGCVIHASRTIHGASANTSGRSRLAYALAFDGPPRRREGPQVFPWHADKQTLSRKMHLQWLMSGGIFVQAWRKVRQGRFNDPRRFGYKAMKLIRKVFSGRTGDGGPFAHRGGNSAHEQ